MNVWSASCHRHHAGAAPLGGAKTPVQSRQPSGTQTRAHAALLIIRTPQIHSYNCKRTSRTPSTAGLRQEDSKNVFNDNKKSTRLSLNYECRSGAWLSCGTLADGKLWVKAGGAATFIDFQIQRLQVFGIPLPDLFYSGIVRLEDFDIRSALFFLSDALWNASPSDVRMAFRGFVADNGE